MKDTPIKEISEGAYELGLLKHEDGRRAVILVNHDMAFTTFDSFLHIIVFNRRNA